MTKKNLSDLLKEEAATADAAEAAAPEDKAAPAPKAASGTKKATSRSTRTRSSAASSQAKTPSQEASATPAQAAPAADLKPQIEQLQTALKAAQTKEVTLNKQVKGLQEDLTKQQERLFELKDTLEQTQKVAKADADQLKKVTQELAEAKQVILKMTEAAASPPTPPAAAKAEAIAEPKPALTVKMRHGGDIYQGRRLPAHKEVPAYAIDHGEQKNRMLSDEEIGWVD